MAKNNTTEMSNMTDLVRVLLKQNRLREQQMEIIVTRLMDSHKSVATTPLMLPNLAKTIPTFNGETGDTDATAARLNN